MIWKQIERNRARISWNESLDSLPGASPFQTFEWGEMYGDLGWTPLYMEAAENGTVVAMALILVKRLPFNTGIALCIGGQIKKGVASANVALFDAVRDASGLKRLFLRTRFDIGIDVNDSLELNANGWSRALSNVYSNFTLMLDLTKSEDELFAGLTSKWRRNLRRGKENGLIVQKLTDPDIDELHAVLQEMEKAKGLKTLFPRKNLEKLFEHHRSNFVFFTCRDEDRNLHGFRGSLISGSTATDYIAATTALGRNNRASFVTFWEMLSYCKANGITDYDLGGIDPAINPGVYKFKRGTGAKPFETLGEWDRANPMWLLYVVNILISRKSLLDSFRFSRLKPRTEIKRLFRQVARATGVIS